VNPETFRESLTAAGLGDYVGALQALIRPSIRLTSEVVEDADTGSGQTKLGGRPDLPTDFKWPQYSGAPQSFIAQVNLAETHACDVDGVLPATGLLSFFYDSSQNVWGYDPEEDGAWAVHYTPDSDALIRHTPPTDLPAEASFGAVRLDPSPELTYAPWEFSEIAALNLTRDQKFAYADALGDDEDMTIHRLLGHPDPIQGDMQLECQLVAHGLYCGDASAYRDPRAGELARGASDWRLLLQIDSDDDAGMMWGDAGRIYFWMHKDDLAARNWEQSRLVLQCS
jgi:uncharacterized protein YwqG